MANYRAAARRAARRYGLDPEVFVRQIQQESGFNPRARSPAGARGIAQIMPDTARGWGVNPDNPTAALNAAARNMANYVRKYGGYENALRAYNAGPARIQASKGFAETNHYVQTILGGRRPSAQGVRGGGGRTAGVTLPGHLAFSPDLKPSESVTRMLASLAEQRRPMVQSSGQLQAPEFSAQAPMPKGFQLAQSSAAPAQQSTQDTVTEALAKIASGGGIPNQSTPGQRIPGQRIPGAKPPPAALKRAKGVDEFEGKPVAAWIAPILRYARSQGWQGNVNSGYRSTAEQRRIYASGVRPAAKPGTSNHEFTAYPGGAIDVSDAQRLSNILRRSKYKRLLVYAGAKDPVHFSHPHGGSY